MMANISELEAFTPQHSYFIGVDSDGCAIDQMNIKHYECFTPAYIKAFSLQPISTIARETAIFVNLFSATRGINRWASIDRFFDLLKDRPEVVAAVESGAITLPEGNDLKAFLASGVPLSFAGIKQWEREYPSAEIRQCIEWGQLVNKLVAWMVMNTQPFEGVRESFEEIAASGKADTMVVSSASLEMLHHEWNEHNLAQYMSAIAGQEMGTKAQQIHAAAKGKYPDNHILLLGDAPGDGVAAASEGVLWYPIVPGEEAASWLRFREEALGRFFAGTYAGEYQQALIAEYSTLLPEKPSWPTVSGGGM
ncbi:MAG: hypothetical protein SPF30_07180 [Arcanobacterium sp.]|nr:hypothetical protein [Arcanobacterium sp.]